MSAEAAREHTRPAGDAVCETCEYSLAGLPAKGGLVRCPECGRTTRLDPRRERSPRTGPLLAVVADSFVVAITFVSFGWGWAIAATLLLALFWAAVVPARGAIARRARAR